MRAKITLEYVKKVTKEIIDLIGYTPNQNEFDRYAKQLGYSIWLRGWRTRYTDFESHRRLMEFLGFEFNSNTLHSKLETKIQTLGLRYKTEIPISIEDQLFRVDFLLDYKGFQVYLEINGSSHYSQDSFYHKNGGFGRFSSKRESFEKKIKRDKLLRGYFNERKLLFVELEYHHFLRMSITEILDILTSSTLEGVYSENPFIASYNIENVSELLKQGKTHKEIAEVFNSTRESLLQFISRNGLNHLSPKSLINTSISPEVYYSVGKSFLELDKNIRKTCQEVCLPRDRVKRYLRCLGLISLSEADTVKAKEARNFALCKLNDKLFQQGFREYLNAI